MDASNDGSAWVVTHDKKPEQRDVGISQIMA